MVAAVCGVVNDELAVRDTSDCNPVVLSKKLTL